MRVINTIFAMWSQYNLTVELKNTAINNDHSQNSVATLDVQGGHIFSLVSVSESELEQVVVGVYLRELEEGYSAFTSWENKKLFGGDSDTFTTRENHLDKMTKKTYFFSLSDDLSIPLSEVTSEQAELWISGILSRLLDTESFERDRIALLNDFDLQTIPKYSRSYKLLMKWLILQCSIERYSNADMQAIVEANKGIVPKHKINSIVNDVCEFSEEHEVNQLLPELPENVRSKLQEL